MKTIFHPFLTWMLLVYANLSVHAYEPPSDGQIDNLLANPAMIKTLVDDASGEQAAALMVRIIARIDAASLGPRQVDYLISFYTARITTLLPVSQRDSFATVLVANAPAQHTATLYAGLTVGGGADGGFVDTLKGLAGDDATLLTAVETPNIQLTNPVYTVLVSSLGSAVTLPPAPVESLPPSDDIPEGDGSDGGDIPPIPPPYAGQG